MYTSSSAVADEPARLLHHDERQIKQSRDHNHAPFVGDNCHPVARIDIAYLRTKFDDFKFSRSSDMIGAPKILKWVT